MNHSIEAAVIESVLEDNEEGARNHLITFHPWELDQFRRSLLRVVTLIDYELSARTETISPVADTGEINIIRGTG